MSDGRQERVRVDVESRWLAQESDEGAGRYAFAYTITVTNLADVPVRLLDRHWIITDADGSVREVHGEGVVGQQPWIAPGVAFRYTSGAVLGGPVGTMEGTYGLCTVNGEPFPARIPRFTLAKPGSVH